MELNFRYFKNAIFAKWKNKRIKLFICEDGRTLLYFHQLSDDHSPRAYHEVRRGKEVITGVVLTVEATLALYEILSVYINNMKHS